MVAMKLMNVFILTIYLSVVMDPTACSSFVLRYQGRTKENCHQLDSFHYAPNKALRTAVNSTARYMQLARGGGGSPPKLSQWIGPALMSALSYALYNLSIKIASKSINPVLGGVILQVVAAMLGSCLLGVSHEKLNYDRKGLLYSIFAGIAVGMAEILSFQVSASGVEASKSIPGTSMACLLARAVCHYFVLNMDSLLFVT